MKPPTLSDLYRDLHQVDAELLAARQGRIGSRWWDRRVAKRQRLRSEITGVTTPLFRAPPPKTTVTGQFSQRERAGRFA